MIGCSSEDIFLYNMEAFTNVIFFFRAYGVFH